jgi:sulfur-oxidizing protein SoxZ
MAVRVVVPQTARKGDVVEIKTLIQHPMETGYRRDNMGRAIPRHIIERFSVTYDGAEVFAADLTQGMAANPYIAFSTVATASGEIVFTWTDEKGAVERHVARIKVT